MPAHTTPPLRAAGPQDVPGVIAFLRRHEATSMFALTNLVDAGLDGSGPHGMRVWIAGAMAGVVGVTRAGMVLPQWPEAADWAQLRAVLAGVRLEGLLGPAPQVRAALSGLGLGMASLRHDADEPGFTLDLDRLIVPEARLTGLDAAPSGLVEGWRAAYLGEVFGAQGPDAAMQAVADVARWRGAGSHHLMWQDGAPVALCGVNAALPDVVQVGGVYVPPALRGQGHARRAVAAMLGQARARGIRRAVLFAASAAAARAYSAIGFLPADPIGLLLFDPAPKVQP